MIRLCLDLNVWFGAILSEGRGRSGTATQCLVDAVRSGVSERGPIALVISWGMLGRLTEVLISQGAPRATAQALAEAIAAYARQGPSLTLGGVGVLPFEDEEDRHVMETAFAGEADLLVTHNISDFIGSDVQPLVTDLWYGAHRGERKLLIAHTYAAAAWLRGDPWPDTVEAFVSSRSPAQG